MDANVMTVEQLEAAAREMGYGSDDMQPAVLLLAAAQVGPDQAAAHTGYPSSVTDPLMERLRANGIFKGDKVHADWFDPEHGGTDFALCVACAMGYMNRR